MKVKEGRRLDVTGQEDLEEDRQASCAAGKSSKQKFSLAQSNPSSQVDLPSESGNLKRVSGKREVSSTV